MLYGPKLLVDGKNHNVMSNYNSLPNIISNVTMHKNEL